jgi:hypothetical protein
MTVSAADFAPMRMLFPAIISGISLAEAVVKTTTGTMPADSRVELEKSQISKWERSNRTALHLSAPHQKISPLLPMMN